MATASIDLRVQNKQAIGALKQFDRSLTTTNVFVANLAANLATDALRAFGRGLVNLASGSISAAADLEQTSIQFRVLVGNARDAERVLGQVARFAASTPFTNPEVERAARQLLTFGTDIEDLQGRLMNLGDISAVAGIPIAELATIFGQVSAAGKLTGERLLQLEERGVGVRNVLAEELGIAVSEVSDRISAGSVSADIFGRALNRLSRDGGAAAGGIDMLSRSFNGAIATFESGTLETRRTIGNQLLPFLSAAVRQANTFFENNGTLIKTFALTLGIALGEAGVAVADFSISVVKNINPAINAFRITGRVIDIVFQGGAQVILNTAAAVSTAFSTIIGVVSAAANALNRTAIGEAIIPQSLLDGLSEADKAITSFATNTRSSVTSNFSAILKSADTLTDSLGDLISPETRATLIANITQLRTEFMVLTESAKMQLDQQDADTVKSDANKARSNKNKAIIISAQERALTLMLTSIAAERDAQLSLLSVEQDIAAANLRGVNSLNEINAIQELENEKVEITRQAALKAASAESDANKRTLSISQANANAEVSIEKNKVAAIGRIRESELRARQGYQTAISNLISAGLAFEGAGVNERKGFAIAQATINAYAGASRAFVDYPYPASLAVAASVVAAGLVQVHNITNSGSFQNGGIIPGNSFSGDRLTANVNSGELILNRAQQNNVARELSAANDSNLRLSRIEDALSRPLIIQNANGQMFAELTREGVRDGINLNG